MTEHVIVAALSAVLIVAAIFGLGYLAACAGAGRWINFWNWLTLKDHTHD